MRDQKPKEFHLPNNQDHTLHNYPFASFLSPAATNKILNSWTLFIPASLSIHLRTFQPDQSIHAHADHQTHKYYLLFISAPLPPTCLHHPPSPQA